MIQLGNEQLSYAPTRLASFVFRAKANGLRCRRGVRDWKDGLSRHRPGAPAEFPYPWSEVRTPLWTEESLSERHMQMGKVQNLRCALRHLDGVLVPAGGVFSFWKQIGQATRARGYVAGRELREGCLIPAIGGGLCQLSNALYEAALQADMEIVERHGHSQIIPGSSATVGRDATVAWNYVDLRLRAPHDWLIRARLTGTDLEIRFCGREPLPAGTKLVAFSSPDKARNVIDAQAHSCMSCNRITCFRHVGKPRTFESKTAWLLDETWPEFQEFLKQHKAQGDELLLPLKGNFLHRERQAWDTNGFKKIHTATRAAVRRGLAARRLGKYGAARLQAQLGNDEHIALSLGHRISYDAVTLVVSQSLLPYLWRGGFLGGRKFSVLMTRLPLQELHTRLDAAARRHPDSKTLGEFRAPDELVHMESEALQHADSIVSPHSAIAALFPQEKVQRLQWALPQPAPILRDAKQKVVWFPGPTAARKGAWELREALKELNCEVILTGNELEGDGFWEGIRTRRVSTVNEAIAQACVAVQPAFIEDNPRLLLRAIAHGLPVIASPACGLLGWKEVRCVPAGDVEALIEQLNGVLDA